MALARGVHQILTELRRLARLAKRRPQKVVETAALIARLLSMASTVVIEERSGALAIRFRAADAASACLLTCLIRDADDAAHLTGCERAVADHLCDGRTLAQIARLRGVTINTIKSQVRQIFRKLDVDSRVALVRRLCP
jgi:DNA-binding NarL/FixJ family response regulator